MVIGKGVGMECVLKRESSTQCYCHELEAILRHLYISDACLKPSEIGLKLICVVGSVGCNIELCIICI